MKRLSPFIILFLCLLSCSEKGNHFHLEGKFKNINQGDDATSSKRKGRGVYP